jgi:hypothetical protein
MNDELCKGFTHKEISNALFQIGSLKTSGPDGFHHLFNVIYKMVSKCLVNRLRPLLQDLVEPMQSDFVPGRLITDNALITFECLHAIK